MLHELKESLSRYSYGQIDLLVLEDWIVGHLQDILDSGNDEAIRLANEFDALFIALSESLISEKDIFERASTVVRRAETVSAIVGDELASASTGNNGTIALPDLFRPNPEVRHLSWVA